jgi:chromosome segregation ATPase
MINENLNPQNIDNYDDEEEDKKEIRQNISNENDENENYIETGNNLVNPMVSEIEQLKEALVQANDKINVLVEENNKLKSSQVDNIKQLSIKDSIIDSNKQEISRLLTKKSAFETEDENNKKTIKELNYKIIELNQKIESNETMNKISKKIKNEKPDNIEQGYLIQINELYNKINEIEIKNSKLEFENKILNNKIDIINKDKKNELEIMEALYRKKYDILEKNLERLNDIINELLNEKQREPIDILNFSGLQNDIYKHFAEFEEKIRKLNQDNILIKKENMKLKNENEELSIIINGKETIIEKLQSNINKIENDFRQKISEINAPNIINNYDNNENMEQLLSEQKRLMEENEILKNNYDQINQSINEANELFVAKQKEYENTIKAQKEKLKEYKFKISILKIKVNELHSEIAFLQERQIQTSNNIIQQNNLLSTIEKDRNSIEFNFTPEQMKLVGADKTPTVKPKIDFNSKINDNNNLNTNENK